MGNHNLRREKWAGLDTFVKTSKRVMHTSVNGVVTPTYKMYWGGAGVNAEDCMYTTRLTRLQGTSERATI